MIDTSLFEASVAWVESAVNGYKHTGNIPERHGTGSNLLVPYQTFETTDKPICIAAGNDRLFVKCAAAMGHPEWASDPRFSDGRKRAVNKAALIALMEPLLLTQSRDAWMAALTKAGVPCAPVNDIADLVATPQLAAMDMMRKLPGSNLDVVGLPLTFNRERPHPYRDSPKLGEHNDEVLWG